MSTPRYEQLAAHLRGQIVRGELKPGDRLPSERELAETWKISRGTVVAALGVLRIEGLIEAKQGVGTLVRDHLPLHRSARERYETAVATGLVYTAGEHARIISAALAPAPDHVASALGVDQGADVVRRTRITYEGSTPTAVSTSWFRGELAKQAPRLLDVERIREGTTRYVELATGRSPERGRAWWMARLATPSELDELGLTPPAAVAETRSLEWDTAGEPLEYGVSVSPAERWSRSEEYRL